MPEVGRVGTGSVQVLAQRRPRRRIGSEAGSAAIVGFAVVLVIFTTSLAAFLMVLQAPDPDAGHGAVLDAAATAALVDLVDTAGYAVDGGVGARAWQANPDKLTRFGLAVEGQPGTLDLGKLRAAAQGGLAADGANAWLDYEEARAALGLGEAGFHLRAYPLWDSLAEAGATPIRGVAVAYVGDFASVGTGTGNYPVQNTSAILDGGSHVYVNLTVVNNGTTTTMFQVQYRLDLDDDEVYDTAHTPMLAPGARANVTLRLLRSLLWEWEDAGDQAVHLKVYDPVKKVGDFALSLAVPPMNTGLALDKVALTISPQQLAYGSNQFPKVRWTYWTHDGDTANAPEVNITLRNSAGAALHHFQGDNSAQEWQVPQKLPEGAYNVSIRLVGDPTMAANDTIVVEDDALGQFTSSPASLTESPASRWERGLLAELVEGFRNTTYNATAGHVYMDELAVMEAALAANLTAGAFDALVVGSGVDHAALAGAGSQAAVRDFVLAGGLLVVLGSADQSSTWLQALFAAATGSPQGVDLVDPSHPILHFPQELRHQAFLDGGRRWSLSTPGAGGHFTHVLGTRGGWQMEDVLAVSRQGHFGSGAAILSAWQLAALTPEGGRGDALATLYAFLRYGAAPLYLEVGPVVPGHAEVASATRVATAPNPLDPGARVFVRVTLWTFR